MCVKLFAGRNPSCFALQSNDKEIGIHMISLSLICVKVIASNIINVWIV